MREEEIVSVDALSVTPGGAPSFEREALPCLDAVYRFARSLARNVADAEDLAQDTLLKAFRSWHTFREGADCRRWLFAICHNTFLRAERQAQRRATHETGDADTLPAVMLHAGALRDGTDALLTWIELGPALRDALDRLAEPFRSAVLLVDGEGYTYQEAAELLGAPVGTVRSRLFRGRRLLQEVLLAQARDVGLGRSGSEKGGYDV
jgi:RNA polymerase sigma-70 factor (ECF subfamily)